MVRSGSGPRSDLEALGDRLLGLRADETIDEFAVFENEHGRYARDLKTRSSLRVLIDVQLRYAITPL